MIAAVAGAMWGLGLTLIVAGFMPRPPLTGRATRRTITFRQTIPWTTGAVAPGAVVLAATGWPVAALGTGVLVGTSAAAIGGQRQRPKDADARLDAIASWSEQLPRIYCAPGALLGPAITTTAHTAAAPIATSVARLAARLDRERPGEALRRFADEIDDPAADLVAGVLVTATTHSGNTAELLSELAQLTRQRVERRKQIEAERATTRMDMRIVLAICTLAIVGLVVFARSEFFAPYGTAAGQTVMVVVFGVFVAAVVWARRARVLSAPTAVPERQGTAMMLPLTVGALLGAGVWLIVLAVVPSHAPLAATIARLHRHAPSTAVPGAVGRGVRLADRLGFGRLADSTSARAELAVLERPTEIHAAQLALAAITGTVAPLAIAAGLRLAGVRLGVVIPVWAAVLGAAAAVGIVVLNTREVAARERTALRTQLGAYLDVLAMLLASAEADEQALNLAAHAGDARLFRALQRSYREAAIAGRPLLTGIRALGERWALTELVEIADAGSLAASDGAAVRRTLAAKARAMRTAQLAAEETDARLRTNRLGFPQILLAVGFIVLILYPAFAGLLTDLNG